MDLEEQRLRHHIEAREIALKQKINMLKERIERFKRMVDVKSQVQQRPGLILMGSVLAGFITRKLVAGKKRHTANTYRTDSQRARSPTSAKTAERFWDPVVAIVSVMASRTAIALASKIVKKLIPRRYEAWRSAQNMKNS